jgi:hypothetical protein
MSWRHEGTYMYPTKNIRLPNGVRIEQRRNPEIHEHFCDGAGAINSWVPQPFVTTEAGSGTIWVGNATAGSYLVGVTGATTDNAQELAGKKVGWNPSTMGGIYIEARFKTIGATTATDGDCYFGFSDAVTESNSLPYVVGATSALTTHAPTSAALFAYSSIATSGSLASVWGTITTKADVDVVSAPLFTSTKDSSFHIFRLEIGSAGECSFFYDDVLLKYLSTGATANIEYTPYLCHVAKNSHAVTTTVDYITVGAGTYV